jgi:hypothetical protein
MDSLFRVYHGVRSSTAFVTLQAARISKPQGKFNRAAPESDKASNCFGEMSDCAKVKG